MNTRPDYINAEGTKWWREPDLSSYATRKDVHGVSLPATCFLAETKDGRKSYVLTSKTLAEHAYRTEFHRSRKLVAAGRTGALGLRAHGPNRPSVAIRADSNTTLHPSGAKSASTAPWHSVVPFHEQSRVA